MNQNNFTTPNNEIPQEGAEWGSHHIWNWNGFECHWRVLGENSNQPIVLIHGFGASSEHWRNNVKELTESGFCVYAIDLIGFGKSEQPSTKKIKYLENIFWANQLKNFLEEIVLINNYKKAVIIGNSLGGLVALTTVDLCPKLIETIITSPLPDPALLNGSSNNLPNWLVKLKFICIKIFFYLLPLEIIVPLISRTDIINYALNSAYSRNILQDVELKRIVREPARRRTAARALRAMCLGMTLREASSTAPELLTKFSKRAEKPSILMVWGQDDKLVPLFIGKELLRLYPWIKLLVIKNSGHCSHDESPEYFNKCILNWLKINLNVTSSKA